jgi:hypothetical protein
LQVGLGLCGPVMAFCLDGQRLGGAGEANH